MTSETKSKIRSKNNINFRGPLLATVARNGAPDLSTMVRADSLLAAFLGVGFQQAFCQQDRSEDLRPLRNDVSDDLTPF